MRMKFGIEMKIEVSVPAGRSRYSFGLIHLRFLKSDTGQYSKQDSFIFGDISSPHSDFAIVCLFHKRRAHGVAVFGNAAPFRKQTESWFPRGKFTGDFAVYSDLGLSILCLDRLCISLNSLMNPAQPNGVRPVLCR